VIAKTRSLVLFQIGGGARVASRNAIATIGLIIIVLGSAPDPWPWLRFLALGVAGTRAGNGPLLGLAVIALGLARDAVPRLTLGLGGWTRSLPADGVAHRRGILYALPIIQLPLATAVVVAAALTAAGYHIPLSAPKLLGAGVALVAAGGASIPSRRQILSAPCFVASTLSAASGRWTGLAASLLLFVAGDLVAGPLRFPVRRRGALAASAAGSLRMFRFTWRAIGWRLLLPLPIAVVALSAAWFYSRNNGLGSADTAFVARLWSTIALALYVGGVADIIVTRRPSWPWIRSLPWSSTDRTIDDAIAIGAPAVPIALGAGIVHPATAIVALAMLVPFSVTAALLIHGARRRLTRVSGAMIVIGGVSGTVVAFVPFAAALLLACTPLLVRVAARKDRRTIVTGWKELHHDAAGDSLAWSER
jgi:hypothetical protein